MQPTAAPYGSWRSPITTDMLTADSRMLHEVWVEGRSTYWLEGRPSEGGRTVVVRDDGSGHVSDVVPTGFDVRSRVHEYGGGAYAVHGDLLVFVNFVDQRVYRIDGVDTDAATEPRAITPEGGLRYGDLRLVFASGRPDPSGAEPHPSAAPASTSATSPYLICVREDHSTPGTEAVNEIVRLDLDGPNSDGGRVLASGTDFVAAPAVSPDGTRLAWVAWQHPNMPWDGTMLQVAGLGPAGLPVDDGVLTGVVVAGGPTESISQPVWAPDGRLFFLSDRTGWTNLYAATFDMTAGAGLPIDGAAATEGETRTETATGSGIDAGIDDSPDSRAEQEPTADPDGVRAGPAVVPLAPMHADFGFPDWSLGMSSYAITGDGHILCSWAEDGFGALGLLDPTSGDLQRLESDITFVASVRADGDRAAFVAQYADRPGAVVELHLPTGDAAVLRLSTRADLDAAMVSLPEAVSWENTAGQQVHGFFYPPTNADFTGLEGDLPPLLVLSHGGPTGLSAPGFRLGNQYWTSRGFAVLDVNYGGSAGYGRDYRERLRGTWGLVDVDDCATGALAMADRGVADRARLAIRGGSAGGYTTLSALTFTEVFAAGASHFGVGDLEALAKETHKFESRYLDGLIGPYPEARNVYVERSPIHHVDRLNSPMILFQGADDKVVPPNQAETMAEAVRRKGLPVAHIVFEGEGHGFRKASSQKRSLEAELGFYAKIFGFSPADDIDPVPIDNLP